MKFNLICAAILLLLPNAGAAVACPEGWFKLQCRGPVDIEQNMATATAGNRALLNEILLRFQPGDRAAGEDGAALSMGMCSWIDRAFRDGEPGRLIILGDFATDDRLSAEYASSFGSMIAGVQVCNSNPDCRLEFCAKNTGSNLSAYPRHVRFRHP